MLRSLVYAGPLLWLTALLAALISGPGYRWGLWSFMTGFSILKWAVYAAIAALVVSVVTMILTRPGSGHPGFYRMIVVAALSLALLSVPAYWLYRAKQVPRIHDISTDMTDPPQFVAVLPLRKEASNSSEYGGADIAAQQRQAYADIGPLFMKGAPATVYKQALAVVKRLGWEIVAAVPEELRIEATDTTFWFGFKDDIVIRIRADSNGSRLDIRSVSRVGLSDVGTNARRIRTFIKMME